MVKVNQKICKNNTYQIKNNDLSEEFLTKKDDYNFVMSFNVD